MIAPELWKRIKYQPHQRQLEFHESPARFKVAICGRRFGKSRMAAAEVEPKLMNPDVPCRGWIVAPQYDTGEKEFRYVWQDLMQSLALEPLIAREGRRAYNLRTGEMYIQMPWGSRLDVKSADRTDSLIGEGLDFVIMSEAAKQREDVWEKYIRPALADRRGSAIFPTTPEGFNWLYKLYLKGRDPNEREWESWNFPSWENPYVYPGGFDDPEIQDQLRTPDDPVFWQEIGADFRSVVGLVYPEWSDLIHIVDDDDMPYRPEWNNLMAVDFGYANPCAILDIMEDPEENLYIWREQFQRFKTSEQNAIDALDRPQPEGYHINEIHCDAASPDGIATFQKVYRDVPVLGIGDSKDVLLGINEIKKRLKDKKIHVARSCTNLINEFNTYKTPKGQRNQLNLTKETEKKNDHGLDALRYLIVGRYVVGAEMHMPEELVPDVEYGGEGIFRYDEDSEFSLTGGSLSNGW
jgi:Terminase RNaseH-like domain